MLELIATGKVREMYADGDDILMVASDRISAYDVVLPTADPRQGQGADPDVGVLVRDHRRHRPQPLHLPGRAGGGRRAGRCGSSGWRCTRSSASARGYITGSGWKEYQQTGTVCGIELPAGLQESDQLPEPIFTPATKAEIGDHDENVDFERAVELVGDRPLMEELRGSRSSSTSTPRDYAAERGIIIADTKFEFGASPGRRGRARRRGPDARLVALLARRRLRARPRRSPRSTSSTCATGSTQSGWDHTPPGPELPDEVVANTRAKYVEAYERITGRTL